MNTDYPRNYGILMHITSLPSPYGIGELSSEACRFADRIREAGATLWQVLPIGPTNYGNSPYSPRSTFAGNELMISIEKLEKQNLLKPEDIIGMPDWNDEKVEFDKVYSYKMPLLKKAACTFIENGGMKEKSFKAFLKDNGYWLQDYAAYMVLYEKHLDSRWYVWPDEEKDYSADLQRKIRRKNRKTFDEYLVMQYFFHEEWKELRTYCNRIGVRLIGDMPIYMGPDSVDSWTHREILKCNEDGSYSAVAGVPPDIFSSTGQLWGNPVYDWKRLEDTGFRWWIERVRHSEKLFDIVRIDHFRGLDSYYEIKANAKTAEHGRWVHTPGKELFTAIRKELGDVKIIAEDLGILTRSVEKLRKWTGFPGMKIAQFGFTRDDNGYYNAYDTFLPHNYERDFVAYTGTHDNNTTRGWFESLPENEKHSVREYLSSSNEEIVWSLIRAIMLSHADTAMIPMQDVLELGEWARMNFPSTCNEDNWAWRMKRNAFDEYRMGRLSLLSRISGRNGMTYTEKCEYDREEKLWKESI